MAEASDADLRTQVAVQNERIRAIQMAQEGFAATAREVWASAERLEAQGKELENVRAYVGAAERRMAAKADEAVAACAGLADRLTKASDQRLVSKTTVTVALLGFAGTLVATVAPHL